MQPTTTKSILKTPYSCESIKTPKKYTFYANIYSARSYVCLRRASDVTARGGYLARSVPLITWGLLHLCTSAQMCHSLKTPLCALFDRALGEHISAIDGGSAVNKEDVILAHLKLKSAM